MVTSFAEDMFSVFPEKRVMDTKTGVRYRKEILEKAATIDDWISTNFLGREPNSDAFLESLGLKNLKRFKVGWIRGSLVLI